MLIPVSAWGSFLGVEGSVGLCKTFKAKLEALGYELGCGKLKQLHFIAREGLGSAPPSGVSWWPAWALGRTGGSWLNGMTLGPSAGGEGAELPSGQVTVDSGRLSTSNYSNLFFFPFLLILHRKSGYGRSSWQPCRGNLLAKACVSLEVSGEGFLGFAFIVFPIKFCEGEQESKLFPLSVWKPWEEQKELLVLESCHRGVMFASMTSASMQRINCAADFPPWESARQSGFHPVTLSLP